MTDRIFNKSFNRSSRTNFSFHLENIYLGKDVISQEEYLLYKTEEDGQIYYKRIIGDIYGSNISFLDNKIYMQSDIEIYSNLKEFADKHGLNYLLLDNEMNIPTDIAFRNIALMLRSAKIKAKLSQDEWKVICENAKEVADYISDLLGLNISTNLVDSPTITKVLVENESVIQFRKVLAEFIAISLLPEYSIIITKDKDLIDYRIKRAFIKSNIPITPLLLKNNFTLIVTRDGLKPSELGKRKDFFKN